jgi:PAS domain S-box-containing protein
LINSVPDYLFLKDIAGHFVVANQTVAEDLGLSIPDLIGKTDADIHGPQLGTQFANDDQAVIRSGLPLIDQEEFVVTVTGERKWLATSKIPMRNPQGEVIGIVGICRDITAHKQAEDALAASESRWHFALEGAGQGVWDHDLRNRTAYFSPVWREMRGIGPDEEIDPSRDETQQEIEPASTHVFKEENQTGS